LVKVVNSLFSFGLPSANSKVYTFKDENQMGEEK